MNTVPHLHSSTKTVYDSYSKEAAVAMAFMALTAAASLLLSHNKLMWNDELMVLWTDSVPSLWQVAHIQRTSPISLDPIGYHAIVHAAISVFGANSFALRLPSLIGFSLTQVCLFFFVSRIADRWAGIVALAIPAITAAFLYSAEGRPYGLLLGLFGLAAVSWQKSTRRTTRRIIPLLFLSLAIALAINTHYYGILLLVPLALAESARALQNRRFDLGILSSMFIGASAIALAVPYMRGASAFQAHYYNLGRFSPRILVHSYSELLPALILPPNATAFGYIGLALASLLCFQVYWRPAEGLRAALPELVFAGSLTLLPFFAFALACLVTHNLEIRYVLGLVIGFAMSGSVGLRSLVKNPVAANLILVALLTGTLLLGVVRSQVAHQEAMTLVAALTLTPEVKNEILTSPSGSLYVQDLGKFATASQYEPDPGLRSRLTLVYSRTEDMRWKHADTGALTAIHMVKFSNLRTAAFESLCSQPGGHFFVVFDSKTTGDWTTGALNAMHAQIRYVGPAFGGSLIEARFLP